MNLEENSYTGFWIEFNEAKMSIRGVLSKTKGLYENEHEEKRFTHKSN